MDPAFALDLLLSRQQLGDLVAAYSRAVDRADTAALAALFHPGAIADSGVIRAEGQVFAQRFVAWVDENAAALSHAVCSSWFEIRGETAVGESYVLASCRLNAAHGHAQSLTAGRYLDRYARIDGCWKFSERCFVVDCVMPMLPDAAASVPQVLRGRFGADDPVHAWWRTGPCS